MRVRLWKSKTARLNAQKNWHDHFALWPVRTGEKDGLWLETVDRRRVGNERKFQYRRKA